MDSLLLLENVFIKASQIFNRIYIFVQPKELDAYLSSFVGNQPYQAKCEQGVEVSSLPLLKSETLTLTFWFFICMMFGFQSHVNMSVLASMYSSFSLNALITHGPTVTL